ncbi:MAG TPA: efflux transporter outer membrane subunit [Burkholderiaceae bacterium]|mgnify:CR=1 FL=1|nr:efflux transporter outer membrane subunit [Burkholderiaceae bacterium]
MVPWAAVPRAAPARQASSQRLAACASIVAAAVILAACATPPQPPSPPPLDMPAAWRLEAPWQVGKPSDTLPKGPWWQSFGDARLNRLIEQALTGSPTLEVASARLEQARRNVDAAEAAALPQLGANARVQRAAISANRPLTNFAAPNFSTVQNDFAIGLAASYELDLSGRVRATLAGARASAEQVAADYENTRLVLTADLASAYYNLAALDIEIDAVARSIALQRRALEFVSERHRLGASSGLELAQQQALLDATMTQVDVLRRQRAQFENALGTLTGAGAPAFTLPPEVRELKPPPVPLGVPSDVLQRRPDVASASRAMAAANAQIGVANAAFYPSVMLQAAFGPDTLVMAWLFDLPSVLWSIGVSATQMIYDGGRTRANVDFARAGYQATVAGYRRTVLTAMQEVQDGISGLAALERATNQQRAAVTSATRVLDLANARYEGGVATYLEVITAQQSLLTAERQLAQLLGQRLLTSVFLVKALGGGWEGMPATAAAPAMPLTAAAPASSPSATATTREAASTTAATATRIR